MGTIKRRPAAKRDLINIYKHIARNAPLRAAPFLRQIDGTLQTLSDRPEIGSARLPNYPDVRVFPVGRYIIIYRPLPDEDGIDLIRVYHGARDWQSLIGDELG